MKLNRNSWLFKWAYLDVIDDKGIRNAMRYPDVDLYWKTGTIKYVSKKTSVCALFWRAILFMPLYWFMTRLIARPGLWLMELFADAATAVVNKLPDVRPTETGILAQAATKVDSGLDKFRQLWRLIKAFAKARKENVCPIVELED